MNKRSLSLLPLLIFLSSFFTFLIIGVSIYTPSVFATLKTESIRRSPLFERGQYQTDLFTGSAGYSYPIVVPEGTNDLTPKLSFNYNSSAVRDASAYSGIGWQLSRDYIERDVNFTPNNTSDDKFKLYFQGVMHDLIYVSSEGRYHTEVESNLHITKLTTSGTNNYGEYWQVITPDGTKYRFGQASNSELVCNGRNYVTRWNLDLTTDIHDNKIYFTYTESNGASYPSQIKYNNDQSRIIDFNYATATYQKQVYIQGCSVTESSRLSNIQVKINTNLVRQYDLAYSTAGNNQSLLQSITEKGSDGTSTLPGTTFEYKPEVKTWQTTGVKWLDHAEIHTHLDMPSVAVTDVNGDGLADIVRTEQISAPSTTWKVLLNQGNNTWSSSFQYWINNTPMDDARLDRSDVRLVDVTGDNLPDIVKASSPSSWKVWRNTGSSWNTYHEDWANISSYSGAYLGGTGNNTAEIVDVTGDGLADIVNSWWNGGREYRVFRNTGSSWNSTPEVWSSSSNITEGLDHSGVRITDVNGDGLADVVVAKHTGSYVTWYVFKNNGNGWNSASIWINNANLDAYFENEDTVLADVNGDNLTDIVRIFDNGSLDQWKVLLNLGNSWSTTYEIWIPSSANLDLDPHGNKVRMVDVTGDGLVDIVKGVADCSCDFDTWTVWNNNGSSPDLLQKVTTPQGGIITFDYTQAVTASTDTITPASYTGEYFNNTNLSGSPVLTRTDSSINFEWGGSPGTGVSSDNFSVRWTQTRSFDGGSYVFHTRTDDGVRLYVDGELLIDKWVNQSPKSYSASKLLSEGTHTIVMEYYENSGGAVAKLSYQKMALPLPLWLVSQMTTNNGLTNAHQTNDVTTYSYRGGFYKFEDREFRGFAAVDEVKQNSKKKTYVFHQDTALQGQIAEVQTRDTQSNPYAETENIWSTSQTNGIYTVKLTSEKNYTYDSTASNPKVTQVDYLYDSYGNVTKKSELGDTGSTGDERFTYFEYVYNTSDWIVSTPKHTYKNASDDSTKINESFYYYDTHTGLNDTPTKGDLTKEEKWLNGGTNPVTLYQYDSYGNQTQVTDANNHTTTYTYGINDSTHTYPERVTNAKSQQTNFSYDLGTGNLLSETDSNGFTTNYEYDVFGRIIKEIKPYDSSSHPTTTYAYISDGVAPEGIVTSKLEESSASATLDVYTFIDGLGRKIQTRLEAEDTSQQRVIDTFYDPEGEIKKETVPYLASTSAVTITPTPPPGTKFGDGSDGDITISSNTTETPVDSSVTAIGGNDTATVSAGLDFAANQIVLFHQTQGTNAGQWEFARVLSYSGTTLELTAGLTNSYSSSGNNRAQVRVVPQYNDVTVNSGVTWTAKAWNGTTGGILAFLSNGTTTVAGTISGNGAQSLVSHGSTATPTGGGFRGGFGNSSNTTTVNNGEGTNGPSFNSTSANGNGGGAGTGDDHQGGSGGHATSGIGGSGGGGGGGGNGAAGGTAGNASLTTMVFGGAGGGGSGYNINESVTSGGNGGAIIAIFADNLTITGAVRANGGNGSTDADDNKGLGAPGAGGSILLKSEIATLGASLTTATGGTDPVWGRPGGAGRIRVEYETSLTGTTNPTASTSQNTIPTLPAGLVPPPPAYGTYEDPDSNAKFTEWTYDALSRPTIVQNPKGDNKTIAYDHWKKTTIDENGHIKRDYYNAFGKIIKVEEVIGIATNATEYEYNERDELVNIEDVVGHNITLTYDTLGRKTSQVDPDMGTWSYGYDGVGNLTSQTDNRNITETRSYDELNRLTLVNYPNDTDITYTYDGNGKIGTVTTIVDKAGTLNFSYDNRLRKIEEERTVNGTTKTTQFSYDAMDRMKNQTYPDGEVVNYTFNIQGEIDSVEGTNQILGDIDYNALGKITQKDYGNGLTTNYSYNTDDFRLNNIQTGTLQDLNYTYDNVGNITSITDDLTSKTQMFSYDDLDRLKTASESGGFDYEYLYNSIGNLISFSSSGSATTYIYGENNKPHALTSSTASPSAFTYDDNGNMTSDGIKCYQFNEANQLDKVSNCSNSQTIAEYVYDYKGNRMVKRNFTGGTLANTVTSWSDSYETKVIVGGATENTSYYFVNSELAAKKNNSDTMNYFHNDHLGSSSVVTSASGTLVEETKYDPWGEVIAGGTASKFLYTGQEYDTESGLHYYNARYYNSDIHRFTQPDEIIQNVYDPQTLNRYSYVRNNPLRYTDPSGHIFKELWAFLQPRLPAVTSFVSKFIPASVKNSPKVQQVINTGNKILHYPIVTKTQEKISSAISKNSNINKNANSFTPIKENIPLRGSQNPYVRASQQHGIQMHKTYPYGKGYRQEVTLDSGKRVDALNETLKHIKELKPDNQKAIERGYHQLEEYLKELNRTRGGGWTGEVVTYPSLIKP